MASEKDGLSVAQQHRNFTACQNLSLTQKLEKLAVFVQALFIGQLHQNFRPLKIK
jgi:hypothetical protein